MIWYLVFHSHWSVHHPSRLKAIISVLEFPTFFLEEHIEEYERLAWDLFNDERSNENEQTDQMSYQLVERQRRVSILGNFLLDVLVHGSKRRHLEMKAPPRIGFVLIFTFTNTIRVESG